MASARALVIGLDGGSYELLTPLCAAGVMPNLNRLMQSAALAELQSTRPYITPVAWTTFQTGCDPQQHGIWDYRYLDHSRRRVCLNDSARIGVPTIFNAVALTGGQTISINLPMTFPAPTVPGLVVGGLDSPSIDAAMETCPELAVEVKRRGVPFSLGTIWKRVPRSHEELAAGVEQTGADFHGRAAVAEIADGLCDWQLMIVQFQTLDALQHRLWHLLGDEEYADPWWRSTARQAMRALDEAIGRLLELADRRQASVLVVSDHGFGPFRGKISLPTLLEQHTLLRRSSWRQRLGGRIQRAGWKTRKWLRRQRQSQGSTASLERPVQGLAPLNWRRSVATVLHGNLAALVYLNTPERFGCGPLVSEASRNQARQEVMAALRELIHPDSGEKLFEEVYSTQERYDCDPLERQWPDVIGIPAAGFHTRTKFDASRAIISGDENLTGTHRLTGVLMVAGRGSVAGTAQNLSGSQQAQRHHAELRDVAPTLLKLMGIGRPASMTGRVLEELLVRRPAHLPIARGIARKSVRPPALSLSEQETVEARLRDLGYLD
jgi:predicted AlkP superfamily phosphohydrolase/phosphomutase